MLWPQKKSQASSFTKEQKDAIQSVVETEPGSEDEFMAICMTGSTCGFKVVGQGGIPCW